MKDYVAENERILEEWRKSYVQTYQSVYPDCSNLDEYFALDGIMFKGKIVKNFKPYQNGDVVFSWKRESDPKKENELWANVPLRILYLTKDQNSSGDVAWDVRSESFRYPDPCCAPEQMRLYTQCVFFRNLVYSLFGIVKTMAERPQGYDFTNEDALKLADEQIFARINCKKEVGGDRCYDNDLMKAIENDKEVLKRQIDNLDADIFVCCGYSKYIEKSGNRMLNLLNEIGYNFIPNVDDWIYYDKKRNKIAINSYHLSFLQFDYEGMVYAYSEFLKKHPEFLESHRK
jgi:hypothetical protein